MCTTAVANVAKFVCCRVKRKKKKKNTRNSECTYMSRSNWHSACHAMHNCNMCRTIFIVNKVMKILPMMCPRHRWLLLYLFVLAVCFLCGIYSFIYHFTARRWRRKKMLNIISFSNVNVFNDICEFHSCAVEECVVCIIININGETRWS